MIRKSASTLLSTLQAHPELAHHVESLQGLSWAFSLLSYYSGWYILGGAKSEGVGTPSSDESQLQGQVSSSRAWEWAEELVRSCRRLKRVSLPMRSKEDAEKMAGAVHPSQLE